MHMVNIFVKNALTNVERLAGEYHRKRKLNKSPAFSFIGPSGSSVIIELGSSWRNTLGIAVLAQVAFSKDYHEASGLTLLVVADGKIRKASLISEKKTSIVGLQEKVFQRITRSSYVISIFIQVPVKKMTPAYWLILSYFSSLL